MTDAPHIEGSLHLRTVDLPDGPMPEAELMAALHPDPATGIRELRAESGAARVWLEYRVVGSDLPVSLVVTSRRPDGEQTVHSRVSRTAGGTLLDLEFPVSGRYVIEVAEDDHRLPTLALPLDVTIGW